MPVLPVVHRPLGWVSPKQRKRESDRARTAQRQANRALPTNSSTWRRIRASQLSRHPLCETCGESGIVQPATVVDHRNGDAYDNSSGNLASLCASCHSRKTARQDGGYGRPKRPFE